jgi:hypothetical protein
LNYYRIRNEGEPVRGEEICMVRQKIREKHPSISPDFCTSDHTIAVDIAENVKEVKLR